MAAFKERIEGRVAIRHARAEDYERIRELVVNELNTAPEIFTKERFEAARKHSQRYYLVAEADGRVVGFVSGFDDGGNFYGYAGRLVVDPTYRKRGVATMLAEASLAEFRASGVKVLLAGVVRDNFASKELLEKIGFQDNGRIQLMIDPSE